MFCTCKRRKEFVTMTRENVIMFVLENFELEIIRVGDIDAIIVLEESIGGDGPVGFWIF